MKTSTSAPSRLFLAVEEAFTRMKWSGRRVPDREVLEADFETHHTRVRLHVQAFAEIQAVSVATTLGHTVPASRMGIVSELLMRSNLSLTIGAFELDYDAGRVMFRASNVFPEHIIPTAIIGSLVHSALAETDRLTPFLTLILRMPPEELGRLNMKLFLQREDLLPPVPDTDDSSPLLP